MTATAPSERRIWSFVSLLVGGVLILVGGLMGALMMGPWGWAGMGGMMGVDVGAGWSSAMSAWMLLWGVVTGVLVLVSAYNVRLDRNARAWGVVAIVAGGVSLLAMGGYILGAVAAVAGGALAVVEEEQTARERPA